MSLLNRKPVRIGRAQRAERDDRYFVVASEDTHAPKQYFEALTFRRVKVIVLPTEDGLSAAEHVVDRLRDAFESAKKLKEVQPDDEFWLLLDTDHRIHRQHLAALKRALSDARKSGFGVAMSNPCFELWLLLHHEPIVRGTCFRRCDEVEQRLNKALGDYDKAHLKTNHFPRESIQTAIRNARNLETEPNAPTDLWPETAGTRVYLLLESILGHSRSS